MNHMPRYRCLVAIIVAMVCLGATGSVAGEEQSQEFVEKLRAPQLGYHDVVLDYLELMRTSPLASDEFKATIDYEVGITLLTGAHLVRPSQREQQLTDARDSFQKFLAEHPKHALVSTANNRLADLLVERGKLKVNKARDPDTLAQQKKQLLDEAKALYTEAEKLFGDLETRFKADLQQYPKGELDERKDAAVIEGRDRARGNFLQARLSQAQIAEETARIFEPGSDDYKKNFKIATERYGNLYEKYGGYLAGLYARLWQARCHKDLGEIKDAIYACEDLLELESPDPAFRAVRTKALALFLEVRLSAKDKKFPESIAKFKEWEKWARPNEESTPEGLATKYYAGDLTFEHAKTLAKGSEKSDGFRAARVLFIYVEGEPGEFQRLAREKLRLPELAVDTIDDEPADFAEARDRGKEALDRSEDPGAPAEEQAKFRADAIRYLREAIQLRTLEVTVDEINVLRYNLAYLYWKNGELYEAAVMGEFLARRYSGSSAAQAGANIALAAYTMLMYEVPDGEDRQFENERLESIAKHITDVWSGQPVADEAWMMRIRIAVIGRELDKALEHLTNLGEESVRRGEAELMIGQTFWSTYLNESRLPEDQRPSEDELKKKVDLARKTLEAGVTHSREAIERDEAKISYAVLISSLSLAQLSIRDGDAAKAVQWLEDPKIGAYTLVKNGHAVAQQGNIARETYKAALRAFVASTQVDKAKEVMDRLEETMGDSEGAALTSIYLGLGRQLEATLETLRAKGDHQEAAKVARGFEDFLGRIADRDEGNTFRSLGWVGDTLYKLGARLDSGRVQLADDSDARRFYEQSADTFRKIIKRCQSEEGFAPKAGAELGIKVRLARSLRGLRQYKESLDALVEVIDVKPKTLSVQIEAAKTYQEWGRTKPDYYNQAMLGGRKVKKDGRQTNRVWGWGRIAQLVHGRAEHVETFHDARYNLALCRFELGVSKSGTERSNVLKLAENDILNIYRINPQMGGTEWYPQYDKLLRQIQKARGSRNATGLKGLATKTKK